MERKHDIVTVRERKLSEESEDPEEKIRDSQPIESIAKFGTKETDFDCLKLKKD